MPASIRQAHHVSVSKKPLLLPAEHGACKHQQACHVSVNKKPFLLTLAADSAAVVATNICLLAAGCQW